ncbi:putative armadillo-like helical protein [Dioscorea sansibarensis]
MEVKRRTARSLVDRLQSVGDEEVFAEIRLISKHDAEMRPLLADAGVTPLLAHLLSSTLSISPDSIENATASLLNLSISCPEALMSTPGLLDALAAALLPPAPPTASQHAAATLFSLLSVESFRPIIGSKRSIVSALMELVRSSKSRTRSIKDALKALFGISLYPMNRAMMVEIGAVAVLFSLVVKDGRTGIVEDATAVIAQVAGCGESLEAFRKVAGVRVLVDLVDLGTGASERSRENAASALLNLVMSGGETAVGDIAEVEIAEEVVRELAEKGSSRAKSKAGPLLKAMNSGRRDQRPPCPRMFEDPDLPAGRGDPTPSAVSF